MKVDKEKSYRAWKIAIFWEIKKVVERFSSSALGNLVCCMKANDYAALHNFHWCLWKEIKLRNLRLSSNVRRKTCDRMEHGNRRNSILVFQIFYDHLGYVLGHSYPKFLGDTWFLIPNTNFVLQKHFLGLKWFHHCPIWF